MEGYTRNSQKIWEGFESERGVGVVAMNKERGMSYVALL